MKGGYDNDGVFNHAFSFRIHPPYLHDIIRAVPPDHLVLRFVPVNLKGYSTEEAVAVSCYLDYFEAGGEGEVGGGCGGGGGVKGFCFSHSVGGGSGRTG